MPVAKIYIYKYIYNIDNKYTLNICIYKYICKTLCKAPCLLVFIRIVLSCV